MTTTTTEFIPSAATMIGLPSQSGDDAILASSSDTIFAAGFDGEDMALVLRS